jgi:hypothetical protein
MPNSSGQIVITIKSPSPIGVVLAMDDIKEVVQEYAIENGIEDEIEIREVNG